MYEMNNINCALIDLGVNDFLVDAVVRTHGVHPRVKTGDQAIASLCGQLEFKVVGLETRLNQLDRLLVQRVHRK